MKKQSDVQVVVLMGGLGTRLKEYTKQCPKPLVEVMGKPFFDYQLTLMAEQGFCRFLFLIGYRAEMIEEYYGDGSRFGVTIEYCYDGEKLLGTGGAVRRAYDKLEHDFMLIYGDSFMDIDFEETLYRYETGKACGGRALMTVLQNNDDFDKSNVVVKDGKILLYDKHHPTPEMDFIDYGVGMYEKSLFADYQAEEAFDVAEIQHRLSKEGKLTAHVVTRRFYEIGSPASLAEFKDYVRYRFLEEHPAVFLDRDGVINEIVFNEDAEQMDSPMRPEEFLFLENVPKALEKIKKLGYYIFVVTNQPAAAKGKTTLGRLYDINTHFVSQMKKAGVEIDDVFMCPHYPNETKYTKEHHLIQNCDCRKPKSGLLYKAKKKYGIDWAHSFMVGDSYTDVLAGQSAGVRTAFIGGLKCDVCRNLEYNRPDGIYPDLYTFSEALEKACNR